MTAHNPAPAPTATLSSDAEPIRLDLRGLKCPLPVLHTRKALDRAAPGTRIDIVCTDPMALIDIPHLIAQTKNRLLATNRQGDEIAFSIERSTEAM